MTGHWLNKNSLVIFGRNRADIPTSEAHGDKGSTNGHGSRQKSKFLKYRLDDRSNALLLGEKLSSTEPKSRPARITFKASDRFAGILTCVA